MQPSTNHRPAYYQALRAWMNGWRSSKTPRATRSVWPVTTCRSIFESTSPQRVPQRRTRLSVRILTDGSGRMHAHSFVVRCPLTPYDADPLRSSRARPTAWDGITPKHDRQNPVVVSAQE